MVKCTYCRAYAELISGSDIYPHRPDLFHLKFWRCTPCGAYVGCHKNSNAIPLGRLANKELRQAKNLAHIAFDPIWKTGTMSRSQAYAWLSKKLNIAHNECHIGMFDISMCNRVIDAANEYMTSVDFDKYPK